MDFYSKWSEISCVALLCISYFLNISTNCTCSYRAFWVGSPLTDGLFCQRIWQPLKTFPLQRPMEYLFSMPALTEPLLCQFFQSQKISTTKLALNVIVSKIGNWNVKTYLHVFTIYDIREVKKVNQLPNKNNQLFLPLSFTFPHIFLICWQGV